MRQKRPISPQNSTSLFLDPRHQQLQEISSSPDEIEVSSAEKKLNRDLTIASVSLSLATAGALLYSPLSFLSVPGLFWITTVSFGYAYRAFKEGHGVGMDALETIFFQAVFSRVVTLQAR